MKKSQIFIIKNMSTQTTYRQAIPTGEFVGEYEVIGLIGIGSFSGVYRVSKKHSNQIYAMKTESHHSQMKLLQFEIQILKEISGHYFPKYIDSGSDNKHEVNFLIMSYFGASITEIEDYDSNITIETVYNLSLKMLESIKSLHSFGFVHRDIKPNNFLLQNDTKYPIVLVDFGLSARHIDPETEKPYPCINEHIFLGTKIFASIDVLSSLSCGPKDDLIAWFYSFLYMACGSLPWGKEKDKLNVISMKKSFKIDNLNYKFPNQFHEIYDYLKKLKYEETPDYYLIKNLFKNGMKEDSFNPDDFDWSDFVSKHENMIKYEEKISKLTLDAINNKNKEKEKNESHNINNQNEQSKEEKKKDCFIE